MPPKKLQPSNLLPPLPEGSTGVSVLVGVGATVGEVGAAVGLVVGAAVVVVVELKFLFKKKICILEKVSQYKIGKYAIVFNMTTKNCCSHLSPPLILHLLKS